MKRFVLAVLLLVLLAGVFQAGSWYGSREAVQPTPAGARKILYYVDPMNPAHTSDVPGIAPCGMKMEPVYADHGSAGQAPASGLSPLPLRGAVGGPLQAEPSRRAGLLAVTDEGVVGWPAKDFPALPRLDEEAPGLPARRPGNRVYSASPPAPT